MTEDPDGPSDPKLAIHPAIQVAEVADALYPVNARDRGRLVRKIRVGEGIQLGAHCEIWVERIGSQVTILIVAPKIIAIRRLTERPG